MPYQRGRWLFCHTVACTALLGCLVWADEPPATSSSDRATAASGSDGTDATEPAEKNNEGLWPSKRLLRSLLARRAEDVSREYGFDAEQKTKSREAIVDGWSRFLTERRERLQPLLNEFLEMRLDVEAPSKERVQAWAEKAGPVFEELRDEAGSSMEQLRRIVKPEQRIAFEADALKLQAGLALAGTKLQQWQGGVFDASEFWEPLPGERRREREKTENSASAAHEPSRGVSTDKPAIEDQVAAELKSWDKFTAEFIERHGLDPAQRDAVRSCLGELKGRATAHRDRYREEIAQLERRIEASRGETAETEEIRRDVVTLYGPIDEMFAELKRRIEPIPTTEQREAAKRLEGREAGATPAP